MIAYRPDMILHTGDLIYPMGRLEDNPRKFFQPYAEVLATAPIYPCLGNHEYKMEGVEPVSEAFVLPPNGPSGVPIGRNYWFDYGNARFVSIDGNNGESFFKDLAAPWLEEVLRSAGNRWRIVFFHPPVYTHGRYLPEEYEPQRAILKWIVPVMDRHGVELVLCGHNHMYERTQPLHEGQIVDEGKGTIHVTTGAGGANLAHARLPMPDYVAVWNDREHSFTVVDISADTIRLRQVAESGSLIDEHRFCRRSPASAPVG
jgi:3',5'-cyclic AMP phosphodiesterase CpdA